MRATAAGMRLQRSQKVDFPFAPVLFFCSQRAARCRRALLLTMSIWILQELAETAFGRCNGSKNWSPKSHGWRKPWG